MTRQEDRLFQFRRLTGVMIKLFMAAIYSFSISRLVLSIFELPDLPIKQAGIILAALILLAALTWQRFSLLLFSCTWLILLIWAFLNQERLREPLAASAARIGNWLLLANERLLYRAHISALDDTLLAAVICLLLTVICYFMLARFNWPAMAMTVLLSISFWHELNQQDNLFWAIPAAIVVFAAFARDQQHSYSELNWIRYPAQARFMLEAMPFAALTLAAAIGLSLIFPASAWQSPRLFLRLDNAVTDIRFRLDILAEEQSPEGWFSIAGHGFQPQGSRLGGPVVLSDDPVMLISGHPQAMLLRGSTSAIYDGFRWRRLPEADLFSLGSESAGQIKNRAFDLVRPDYVRYDLFNAGLAKMIDYRIIPVQRDLINLFLAGRPVFDEEGSQNDRLFFSADSLLLVKPPLRSGEGFDFNNILLVDSHPGFTEMAFEIGRTADSSDIQEFRAIADLYLQLPELPEYRAGGAVISLARDLTSSARSPWENALQIKSFLMNHARYNLKVQRPPPDVEFVSWFLQTREGYCVYFATAMTMLCRSAGIPARYVEGYAVQAAENPYSPRLVTGRQAHAWTEVYLLGIGWVAVDATPGGEYAGRTPTSTPNLAVTVTPTPRPLTPGGLPTFTPPPAGSPTPEPGVLDPNNESGFSSKWLHLLWFLPVILPIALMRRYRLWHDTAWLTARIPERRQLIIHYWLDIKDILNRLGFRFLPWETPRMTIERVLRETGWFSGRLQSVYSLLDGVEKTLYSPSQPDADEIDAARRLHILMEEFLRQNTGRILFLIRRICYHSQKQELDEQNAVDQ